jgi:hypothetical protein
MRETPPETTKSASFRAEIGFVFLPILLKSGTNLASFGEKFLRFAPAVRGRPATKRRTAKMGSRPPFEKTPRDAADDLTLARFRAQSPGLEKTGGTKA